jgi:CheY-like chemotaxis protein
MPLGGTLTIATRNLPAGSAAPAELAGRDCIAVSVHDTGTGMSEEVLRYAVEPFFTTKEPGKGSGLGLSQVYGMAQQSNGALHIESRVGIGTAVHLFLPRATASAGAAEASPGGAALGDTGGRVLVVDDDAGVRDVTVQMLRQSGYIVIEADSGQAAFEALGRGEVFDLVVIDIAMSGLSGIETIERARRRWPELRALYITGYAEAGEADLDTGGAPLLKKPFRLNELQHAVREALNRRPDGTETQPRQRRDPALPRGRNETAIRG